MNTQDFSKLDMQSLSQMIISNPDILTNLDEGVLCEMVNRLNPYSKVVGGQQKKVLFSFTNFKEDRMMMLKSLSLSRFLEQLINESDDWCDGLKSKLPGDEMDKFKANLMLFKDHFLRYDQSKHTLSGSHTGKDELPPLDFISKWSRYETLNSTELNNILNRNLLYRTNQQSAIQIYGTFDTEELAREFIDKEAKTIGFDILMGETNKWTILQDNEQILDQTEFVGDQNTLINNMLAQMKDDKSIGEKMLKKRMQNKKDENEAENGKHDVISSDVINTDAQQTNDMNIYRQRRLDLGSDDILNSDRSANYHNIPIMTNNGLNIDKKML